MDAPAGDVPERRVHHSLPLKPGNAAKAALSISTVKCDLPLPSSPAWPEWRALSLITASRVGAKPS